jgi:hypothetical protein
VGEGVEAVEKGDKNQQPAKKEAVEQVREGVEQVSLQTS